MLSLIKRTLGCSLACGAGASIVLFLAAALVTVFEQIGPAPAISQLWAEREDMIIPLIAVACIAGAVAGLLTGLIRR